MCNAAERSFWTSPDHPPDLGIEIISTLPSDYFHRNVFAGFQEDAMGIRADATAISSGVDNLLWGSDYPHVESTFPRSRQIIDEILADCSEEEKAKIAGGNAVRIYHLI